MEIILLFIVFITMLICTFKQYIFLNNEISYLPQEIKLDLENNHPLIGESIHTVGPNNWVIAPKNVIIQFVSPTCSSCHSTIEQVIEKNKLYRTEIYVVVMPTDDNKKSRDFIDKYKDIVNFLPYSSEVTEKMDIIQTPTLMIVDQKGVISLVTGFIKKLDYFMLEMVKIQGDNNEF